MIEFIKIFGIFKGLGLIFLGIIEYIINLPYFILCDISNLINWIDNKCTLDRNSVLFNPFKKIKIKMDSKMREHLGQQKEVKKALKNHVEFKEKETDNDQ